MAMILRSVSIFRLFLFLSLFLITNLAFAQENNVTVIWVKGQPKIMRNQTSEWAACKVGTAINNGDRVKTLKSEEVEISFLRDRSNIIRIEENSDIFIKRGEAPYSIELLNGAVMALIKNLPPNSTFEVKTPTGLSGARGTGWESSTDGNSSIFSAFENEIFAKGIDASGNEIGNFVIKEKFKAIVNKFEAPSNLERLSDEEIERWYRWKAHIMELLERQGEGNFNQADTMGNQIDELESRKDNVNEARDENRIGNRADENRPNTSRQGGGSCG